MTDIYHDKLLSNVDNLWLEDTQVYAFSKEDDALLDCLVESVDDAYVTESGKEGILAKISSLFKTLSQKIGGALTKKTDKETANLNPNTPVPADRENFKKVKAFLKLCLKIVSMPLKLIVKAVTHPAKTGVAVIMAFTGVSLFKEYKEKEAFRKEHGIPVSRKDCMTELAVCRQICDNAEEKIKHLTRAEKVAKKGYGEANKTLDDYKGTIPQSYASLTPAQVKQQRKKIAENKKGETPERVKKSLEMLDKMDALMAEKRKQQKRVQTAQRKLKEEEERFRKNADRVTVIDEHLNNETIGFFSHVAKSVKQISISFQKLLRAKNYVQSMDKASDTIQKMSNKVKDVQTKGRKTMADAGARVNHAIG